MQVEPRDTEVKAFKYVTKEELKEFIATAEANHIKLTPWFKLIVDNFIYKWWDSLLAGTIKEEYDQAAIHRMLQ